jgi:hypothetical protein
MSIQAVLSRVDQIAAAQQQLALGTFAGPSTSTAAAPGTSSAAGLQSGASSGTASTSFASALASAQSASGASSLTASGVNAPAANGVAGAVVPQASWNPQQKPIAGWIAPVLQWASQHGWTGSVTSGYRSYSDQSAINASGAFSAPAGKSNHETTTYPGGAVDVTNPGQLLQVLQGYTGPEKLVGGVLGAADPEHFSATGH